MSKHSEPGVITIQTSKGTVLVVNNNVGKAFVTELPENTAILICKKCSAPGVVVLKKMGIQHMTFEQVLVDPTLLCEEIEMLGKTDEMIQIICRHDPMAVYLGLSPKTKIRSGNEVYVCL